MPSGLVFSISSIVRYRLSLQGASSGVLRRR
jgi:hypothetical protein